MGTLFNKTDVLSWVNCQDATPYLGRDGYFADSLQEMHNEIKNNCKKKLIKIHTDDATKCFENDSISKALFISAEKVKTQKYRPFRSHNEFMLLTGLSVGDILNIRKKGNPDSYDECLILAVRHHSDEPMYLFSDFVGFKTAQELFDNYEWKSGDKWLCFGILE